MKRFALILCSFLFLAGTLSAQQRSTDVFNGTLNDIPGYEPSAPVTFTVNNSTGEFSLTSDGNGYHVDAFWFNGRIPVSRLQMKSGDAYGLTIPGSPWSFELYSWSNMVVAGKKTDTSSKTSVSTSTMQAITRTSADRATVAGQVAPDGKSVYLTIRVPYMVKGYEEPLAIPFHCTLDLTPGQRAKASQKAPRVSVSAPPPVVTKIDPPANNNNNNRSSSRYDDDDDEDELMREIENELRGEFGSLIDRIDDLEDVPVQQQRSILTRALNLMKKNLRAEQAKGASARQKKIEYYQEIIEEIEDELADL